MDPKGRLELTWTNKHLRLLSHGIDTYEWVDPKDWRVSEIRTLQPVETVGEAGSGNLLIEGDAAHALDALLNIPELAKQYRGKVKLCYIDPPFNTGQAFAQYNDAVEHSVWLTLLRDRLVQIRQFISHDGSVWVHLDDAEAHRCRSVLDEVFGADNFIATVVWQKADSPRNSARYLSTDQDYIFVYAKDASIWRPAKLPRTAEADSIYRNPDNDPRGPWLPGDPFANKPYSLGLYEVEGPTGRVFSPPEGRYWRISEAKLRELDAEGRVWWGPDGNARPSIKRYLSEVSDLVPRTLWLHKDVGSNRTSSNESRALFEGQAAFATPKPERLLQRILQIGTQPGDLVLDCFAGSATTAAVAHKMGRRWVTSETVPSTLNCYALPRLRKVVAGQDPGGITVQKRTEAQFDLPEDLDAEAVKQAASTYAKLLEASVFEDAGVGRQTAQQVLKVLRGAGKTRDVVVSEWKGGGGFDVARVAPSIFVQDGAYLFLDDWVTHGILTERVAAQLGYTYEPDGMFAGRKGRSRLVVLDGMLTTGVADFLVAQSDPTETLHVVAHALEPDAEEHLRKARPGSRARKVPRDLARPSVLSGKTVKVHSTDTRPDDEPEPEAEQEDSS